MTRRARPLPLAALLCLGALACGGIDEESSPPGADEEEDAESFAQPVSGAFTLKAVNSGKCLRPVSAPPVASGRLTSGACDASASRFVEVNNGGGMALKVSGTNLCLSVPGSANGQLVLETCATVTRQAFTATGTTERTFASLSSGRCIDMPKAPPNVLQQWSCDGSNDQRFVVGQRQPGCVAPLPNASTTFGQLQCKPVGGPKIAGANYGAKHYDDPTYSERLSRLDFVIVGSYVGWRGDVGGNKIQSLIVDKIKARNPNAMVGQYTVLNEMQTNKATSANDDVIDKLDATNWWLRNAAGKRLQWTASYAAYDINFTEWTHADANGDRYPEWKAKRDFEAYFKNAPGMEIWFDDNVFDASRVPSANWRLDGTNVASNDAEVAAAFRRAEARNWAKQRALRPGINVVGNTSGITLDKPEYKNKLNGGLYECGFGKSWSKVNASGRNDWSVLMDHFTAQMENTLAPHLVIMGACHTKGDLRLVRYGLTTTLLTDGYYAFSADGDDQYSTVEWFDEYEVPLGQPVEPALDRDAVGTPWKNGVYRRKYQNGLVLVNPSSTSRTITIEPGYKRFKGTQAPGVNNGADVGTSVTIPAMDGLILVPKGGFVTPN